jgi:hypothetical protein
MPLKFDLEISGPIFKDRSFPNFEIHFKRIGPKQYADWILIKSPFSRDDIGADGSVKTESITGEKALWMTRQNDLFLIDHTLEVKGVDFVWADLTQEQKELFYEQLKEQIPSFEDWQAQARAGAEKKSAKPTRSNSPKVVTT